MTNFINKSIENGINNYINFTNNKPINKTYIYEFHIVKILTHIYGDINIINTYKLNNADSFILKMSQYEYPKERVLKFFEDLDKYHIWLKKGDYTKTNIPNDINNALIDMIVYKYNFTTLTTEDLSFFNEIFTFRNQEFLKINNLINHDITVTTSYYNKKVVPLMYDLNYEEKKPEYLEPHIYESYGLKMEELKDKNYLEINNINQSILTEKSENESSSAKSNAPYTLELTSGSGFVDILVILSVAATEILVGILIMISFLK